MFGLRSLGRKPLEKYKGLQIGCAPGTHQRLVDLITQHVPHRSKVLDLGAHSGALLTRLRDAGFSGLEATDLDLTLFQLDGVPIQRIDLNTDFSEAFKDTFKLITCTEVLEHLDNPRHFFTQVFRLLDDDGYAAISVPNIAFWEGRIKFLLLGEHWGFGARNYRDQRHISPMTREQIILTMAEYGLKCVAYETAGSFAGGLRKLLTLPFWGGLRMISGKQAMGECALILAQKSPPNVELTHPGHFRTRWAESEKIAVNV
jgi:2-polyprenyl-3-methyl-5-hydroxy-6-metoxy-1,4-benzoquinol methylase